MRNENEEQLDRQDAGEFDAQLRRIRPESPPGNLRDRCLPSSDVVKAKAPCIWSEVLLMHSKSLIGGLAVAAAIVVAVLWSAGGRNGTTARAAELLQSALDDLQDAAAIHIVWVVDDGPGTLERESMQMWVAAGLGVRMEGPGSVEIYNEQERKRYVYHAGTRTVRIVEGQETSTGWFLMQRGRQDENIEQVLMKLHSGGAGFRDEQFLVDGRTVRRLSCTDERGYRVMVELDPTAGRILKTESWTRVVEGSAPAPQRVRTTYHHLQPNEIDRSLFSLDMDEDVRVIVASPSQQAVRQCIANLLDLTGALMYYEGAGSDGLPAELSPVIRSWGGFRESMLHCPLVKSNGQLQYALGGRFAEAKSLLDIPFDAVVFECDLHGDRIPQSYGGGHAMVVPRPSTGK